MTNLSQSSNNYIFVSESIIRSTPVVIGTPDNIYTGHIIHFNNERLLDVLNEGSAADPPELKVGFIQLHDIQFYPLDSQRNIPFPNSFIARSGVLFVGEIIDNEIKIPCLYVNRLSSYITKISIDVEIHMPSLTIIGKVYVEPWQKLVDLLNDPRRFFPVTGATVLSKPKAKITNFDFMALNKNLINYISKIEEPTRDFDLFWSERDILLMGTSNDSDVERG